MQRFNRLLSQSLWHLLPFFVSNCLFLSSGNAGPLDWFKGGRSVPAATNDCSKALASPEKVQTVPTLSELRQSGIDVTGLQAAMASSASMFLTSDEGVFSYLNHRFGTSRQVIVLNVEVKNNFSEFSESDIKAKMFRKLFEAQEKSEAPRYAGHDSAVGDYILKYLESGKRFVIAIRFASDFHPEKSGASYSVSFQPWLESLAARFPITIVGLTPIPDAFTNREVGAVAIENGTPIKL